MKRTRRSLRALIADTVILLDTEFDRLQVLDLPGVFPGLVRSREGCAALLLELGFISVLCSLDAVHDCMHGRQWEKCFTSGIAWGACDSLHRRFGASDYEATCNLLLQRLEAFNRSNTLLRSAWSNWSVTYARAASLHLEEFFSDDSPAWLELYAYYGRVRPVLYETFSRFLVGCDIELDDDDRRMISKLEDQG